MYHKSREVTITDVTIPFEADESAFMRTGNEKYCPLAQWLQNKGHTNVTVDAGSLGSWDVDNEALLKRLNVNSKYATLLKTMCSRCYQRLTGNMDKQNLHVILN